MEFIRGIGSIVCLVIAVGAGIAVWQWAAKEEEERIRMGRVAKLSKGERKKAVRAVAESKDVTDNDKKSRLCQSAKEALKGLSIPDRTLGLINQGEERGRHHIHRLGERDRRLKGQIAVDVYDNDSNQSNRGPHRFIFKIRRNELIFNRFIADHKY